MTGTAEADAGALKDGRAEGEEALRITKAHDQPGLIIAGEVDESGYVLLLESLAALDHHGGIHIDLGGIEFCDLAGLRAIVCAGRPGEDASPGRQVCLHAVPPQLLKLMQILGWDDRGGLTFNAASLSSEHQQQSPERAAPALSRPPSRPTPTRSARSLRGQLDESADVRSPPGSIQPPNRPRAATNAAARPIPDNTRRAQERVRAGQNDGPSRIRARNSFRDPGDRGGLRTPAAPSSS